MPIAGQTPAPPPGMSAEEWEWGTPEERRGNVPPQPIPGQEPYPYIAPQPHQQAPGGAPQPTTDYLSGLGAVLERHRAQNNAANQAFFDAYGFFNAANAGTLAGLQQQQNNYLSRLPLMQAAYGDQYGGMQNEFAARQRMLGLDRSGIDLEHVGLGRQIGYYGDVQGVLDERFGFNREQLGRILGIDMRKFDTNTEQSFHRADVRTRDVNSDATARGAYTAHGTNRARGDIQTELGHELELIGQERERTTVNYDIAIRNNLFDQQLAQMNTAEQQARLRDRQGQLDIEAQKLGLQSDVLSAQLQQGLARLNLDQTMSVGSLMDAMNSTNTQQQQLAMSIFQQALQYQGFFLPA